MLRDPLQLPLAEHDAASIADHVSLVDPPAATRRGDAVITGEKFGVWTGGGGLGEGGDGDGVGIGEGEGDGLGGGVLLDGSVAPAGGAVTGAAVGAAVGIGAAPAINGTVTATLTLAVAWPREPVQVSV